jgi:hypothetical protein
MTMISTLNSAVFDIEDALNPMLKDNICQLQNIFFSRGKIKFISEPKCSSYKNAFKEVKKKRLSKSYIKINLNSCFKIR